LTKLFTICIIKVDLMAACGGDTKEGKCEICQKEATLNKVTIEDETSWVCDECEKGLDALKGLADMVS